MTRVEEADMDEHMERGVAAWSAASRRWREAE